MIDIRNVIGLRMKEVGVSRRAMCSDLGLVESNISAYMNGKRPLPLSTIDKICQYLGLEVRRKETE